MKRKPVICLDPGHGGKDSGAVGPHGLRECDVVLGICTVLARYLEPVATVVMTRRKDEFVSLARRATISNDAQANAFLSVHCNAGPPGKGEGFEVFTTPGPTLADAFAVDLFVAFAAEFPEKRKRVDLSDGDVDKEARFTVLTRTLARAALFEVEFIHTVAGEQWLGNTENLKRCAAAFNKGIRAHFQL